MGFAPNQQETQYAQSRAYGPAHWAGLNPEAAMAALGSRRSGLNKAEVAERLARQSVAEPGELVRRCLADAIALVGRCPRLAIHLHPTDAESLEFDKAALATLTRGVGEARVIADESLPPGSCRLESEFGSIDAGLQTQLRRIQQELTG